MHDVIVVGGGPVGCYTASLLAKEGFDVLVLEGNPSFGHQVICTGLIGVEAFERFQLPKGSVVNEIADVTFVSPSGIRFSYRPESPQAFLADRPQFNSDMAKLAVGHGATFRFSSCVRDIRSREDEVIVEVESAGERFDLRSKMAVVACGFNPELTEELGARCSSRVFAGSPGGTRD